MRGNFSSSSSSSSSAAVAVALLAMMVMMTAMFITRTNCFSINQTITVSSSWCSDDPSCFIGETDLDSDEFMLDSEFSRRILGGTDRLTDQAKDPSNPVGCDRPNTPPCNENIANKKDCKDPSNRSCYKHH